MQRFESFYRFFEEKAARFPDKTAVLYDALAVTYAKLFEDVVKKAIHLNRFEGKRVAVYGPASYRWIVNVFGSILAGKDVLLLDFFVPQNIRSVILKNESVDYVLCSTNQYILSDSNAIIIPGADKDDVMGLEYNKDIVEGNFLFLTATSECCDKAVVLSSANILWAVERISSACACDSADKILSQIPLNYTFGFVYSLMWPLDNGACVCVGRGLRHIDSETFYYNPTILPGDPSMIEYLKKIKAFNAELKKVIIGGAPCSKELADSLSDRKFELFMVYGSAETAECIGYDDDATGAFKVYDDVEVSFTESGEVLVSGGCVMKGYDKDSATTCETVIDGVLHTGDYGLLGEDGRLVITKHDESIIQLSTGEKLSRNRVIEEINAINGVAESFVELYDGKLTVVIVPIDKSDNMDKFKRYIDKYNEKKGYRWEIQKIVMLESTLPRQESGEADVEAIKAILARVS